MPKPGPAQVYRFYNSAGLTLYVGVTQNLPLRLRNHASQQPWFGRVSRLVADYYDSWPAASEIEEISIAVENPVYNVGKNQLTALHIVELIRLLQNGEVPASNEELIWELTEAIAHWLGRDT